METKRKETKKAKAATVTAAAPAARSKSEGRTRTFKADLQETGFAERISGITDMAGRSYLRSLAESLCEVKDIEQRISGAMEEFYSDGCGDAESAFEFSVSEPLDALTEAITELIENTLCELSDSEDGTQDDNNY